MNLNTADESAAFLKEFFARFLYWCYAYQDQYWDYWDSRRSNPMPKATLLENIKHRIKVLGGSRGWAARHFNLLSASEELARIMAKQPDYARGYALLADAYSKRVYLDILAFRALGSRHVRLPVNTPDYWKEHARDDSRITKHNTGVAFMGATRWVLNQYDVPGKTGMLHLHMLPGSYQYYFILRGYDYSREGCSIGVESGDVVISGGGCWGEADIIFADRCAPDGRVYTFEFVPDNLRLLRQNLASNPNLARRIEPVEVAMSDVSGQMVHFTPFGPATQVDASVSASGMDGVVATLSIDDLVTQRGLGRVDFIKMDIEGSELRALHGAEKTLRRFRPKLAISAYHKPEDLFAMTIYLDGLQLGYKFYMDHFTVTGEESVLFAVSGN
jgi:FkbM family methyltransferase